MKAILISFFNSNNIGDQLISSELYKMISSLLEVKRLDFSENLGLQNNLKTPVTIKPKQKLSLFRYLLYKIKFSIKIREYRSLIKKADILFIGGGNMLFSHDKYSKLIYKFNKFTSIAIKNKKQVYAISLGIGPFVDKRQEKKAIEKISKCDYISFRDQKSLNIFIKYNKQPKAYLSIDPVFFMNLKQKRIPNKAIGINIINNFLIEGSRSEYEKVNCNYIKLIKTTRKKLNCKIYLFSTDLKDYPAISDIYSRLNNKEGVCVEKICNAEDVFNLYNKISFLIGTRMHAMIIAYTQHLPFIGLSWQQKIDGFFELINREDYKFNYKDISKNLDLIIDKTYEIIKNLAREAEQIKITLNDLRKKHYIDYIKIKKIVN